MNIFAVTRVVALSVIMTDYAPLHAADEPSTEKPVRLFVLPHEEFIDAIEFSPDGKLLATSAGDRRRFFETYHVRLFDTADGDPVTSLKLRTRVAELAFSPRGDSLMIGPYDGKLVDSKSGEVICRLEKIGSLFTSNGDRVIGFGADGLDILDAATGRLRESVLPELKDKPGHSISCAVRSPDGKRFAVVQTVEDDRGSYQNVYLVSEDGFRLTELRKNDYDIGPCVVWPNDKEVLLDVTGSEEGILYDVGRNVSRTIPLPAGFYRRRVSEDLIAFEWGVEDGVVQVVVFDVRANQVRAKWGVERGKGIDGLAISNDGKLMAIAGDRNVTIWKIDEALARKPMQ